MKIFINSLQGFTKLLDASRKQRVHYNLGLIIFSFDSDLEIEILFLTTFTLS